MKKGFSKKIVVMAIVVTVVLQPFRALGSSFVTIIKPESRGESSIKVELSAMKPFARTIESVDPNFAKNGRVNFEGISLKQLFELAGAPFDQGVTVVGHDQYVAYLPFEQVLGERVMLAFAMNGSVIGRLEGGPMKIIFAASENVHGSGYTWYVEAMFSGKIENPGLIVAADSRSSTLFRESIAPMVNDIDLARISIPSGFRDEFPGRMTAVSGITLKSLLLLMGITKGNEICMIPFAGPVLTIKMALADYPVAIVCTMENRSLHPVMGGPFSVQFPIEDYPEIAESVPESGALFFLKKISIR